MTPRTVHLSGERGFIALISTVMITAVLLVLMYATSAGGFYSRTDALGSEFKRISMGLSEACSNVALLKVAQDYNYTPQAGGDSISVGPDTCVIRSVMYVADPTNPHRKVVTITTGAEYPLIGGSWSSTKITATITDPQIALTAPPLTAGVSINGWDEAVVADQ